MERLIRLGIALLGSLVVLGGCATRPPLKPLPSEQDRVRFGRVAVVATSVQTGAFQAPVRDKGQVASEVLAAGAAVTGAGVGVVAIAPACLAGGPIGAAVCSTVMGITAAVGAVATAGGAAAAAASTDPRATAEQGAAAIDAVLAKVQLQELLRHQVLAYASQELSAAPVEIRDVVPADQGAPRSLEQLAALGADSVLEIGQVRLQLVGLFGGSELPVYLAANVRLLRVADGAVLAEQSFGVFSKPRQLGEWGANGGMLFRQALDSGIQTLAEWIVDELFLLLEIPAPPPIHPALNRCVFCGWVDYTPGGHAFSRADSLQPVLRWEPQLRGDASQSAPTIEPRTDFDTSYDVRVYRAETGEWEGPFRPPVWIPSGLIYERRGIKQASHQIEVPLEPCGKYFWTYRARVQVDGRTRVGEWAAEARPLRLLGNLRQLRQPERQPGARWWSRAAPSHFYYPFATPCAPGTSGTAD